MKNTSSSWIFLFFTAIYILLAVYVSSVLNVYHNDAISRTALAFFTVFGRNPHLSAIGFVWQPLPSLLQIPLIILLKPLGQMLLAGSIITAIAGGISLVFVNKIGQLAFAKKSPMSIFISILFGVNPLILLYSVLGTSEMVFICTLLATSYYIYKWFLYEKQWDILLAGFFVALSFWSRYESIPFFLACVLLITLRSLIFKKPFRAIESVVLQFILPFIYTVLMWILLNWLIMGDPLYFARSPYSNTSFTLALKENAQALEYSYHSVVGSFYFILKRLVFLAPIFLSAVYLPILIIERSWHKTLVNVLGFLFLALPYIAILAFHGLQLFKGDSFGWLRFFIYAVVGGYLVAIFIVGRKKYLFIPVSVLLLVGIFGTTFALSQPALGKEEVSFIVKLANPRTELDFSRTYADQKKVAEVINSLNGIVLLDTDKGFAIPLFSNDANRFIITSDIDYKKKVRNFRDSVDWIIVRKPEVGEEKQNIILQYYPGIWFEKVPNTSLYTQIDSWKIFKVNH